MRIYNIFLVEKERERERERERECFSKIYIADLQVCMLSKRIDTWNKEDLY